MTLSKRSQQLLDLIIEEQEGGWVLSKDPDGGDGGWTFGGVTANTFNKFTFQATNYRCPTYSLADNFASLSHATFKAACLEIYEANYFPPHFDELPALLQGPLLSASIHCGRKTAVKLLQTTYNNDHSDLAILLAVDGDLGQVTLDEVNAQFTSWSINFIKDFLGTWEEHYRSIVDANPDKEQFLKGWLNRVAFWDGQLASSFAPQA